MKRRESAPEPLNGCVTYETAKVFSMSDWPENGALLPIALTVRLSIETAPKCFFTEVYLRLARIQDQWEPV